MQAINKNDLAHRIRYYQAAIDVSVLEKNKPYEDLPDSFIICFCTFDYPGKGLPVYTFKTVCREDTRIHLADGITKIIINSQAAEKEARPALKNFLKEYMLINSFERDAHNDGWKSGWKDGMQAGMQQGIQQGFADGLFQKACETAKNLLDIGLSVENISKATGLSSEEIENL